MRPDRRGNNRDRWARKIWLLETFGDGKVAPCVHCGATLTYATLEADRVEPGGSYRRSNIQPACHPCNAARGNNPRWTYPGPPREVLSTSHSGVYRGVSGGFQA